MIRPATEADAPALRALDDEIWSYLHSPVPRSDTPFDTAGVLVDERDGEVAGYVKIGDLWPIDSVRHVRELKGLAVGPRFRGQGVARALIAAAIEHARAAGARKLTLRVLGHNKPARDLYASCGFEVEGNLRGLFLLGGDYVDDILMSIDLTGGDSPAST